MSESETDTTDRGFQRIVREAREQMQVARSDYFSAKLSGTVGWKTKHQLARAVRQYYDALWEYRERNNKIKEAWEDSAVDEIPHLSNETTTVEVEAPGDSPSSNAVQRNALVAADPDLLIALSKQLDELANQMGFAAATKEVTERTEITDEMIEEVEEWRQANLE